MEATLRRLHVGGVGPSVTDVELSERFGRFGKVDEVEIISRKDDQGNPIKTFAYININISDADLKKCTSLLNKTKWKGGVLQVEIAKESFLHKLEQERQAAKEKKKSKEQSHPQNDLLQSLEKAGVTDFQMKAAVPGTEVPNHKNWVVSKYGRVLPVLHIKGNKQSKIMKCDPSKYCHNIKKLDVPVEATPVSQLTWHLDGGEDEISKKRRGEFSEYSPMKKSKVNSYLNRSKSDEKGQSVRTPQTTLQKANDVLAAQHKREKSRGKVGNRSMNNMSDEYDSEEELKAVIEREKMVQESGRHSEDNSIEVVDDSFTPKYKTHWAEEIGKHGSTKDDKEYDSADTDEIITVAKTTKNCSNSKKEKARSSNGVSSELKISKCNMKRKAKEESGTEEESQSNDSEAEDSSDSYSDEEYESMMQNCYRLALSMGDLEALAIEAGQSGSENTDSDQEVDSADNIAETSVQSDGVGELKGLNGHQTTKKKQKSKAASAGDLGPVTCNIGVSSELKISKCNMKRKAKEESGTEEESQSNDSEAEDSSDSYSDEEYESMMQNCYRLDLSMVDLEALVKEAGKSDTDSDQEVDSADNIAETSVQSDGVGELKGLNGHQTTKKKQKSKAASAGDLGPVNNKRSESSSSLSERESGSMEQDLTVGKFKSVSKRSSNIDDGTDVPSEDVKAATKTRKEAKNYQKAEVIGNQKRKKGIEPDDIVTSILEDDEDSANDRRKRKKKKNPPVLPPAFKGLGSLMPLSNSSEPKASMPRGQNTTVVDVGNTKQDSKTNSQIPPKPVKTTSPNVQQRSERDDDDGGSSSSSSSSSGSSSDESSSDEPSSTSSPLAKPKVTPKSSTKEQQPISKAKQLQDNQKRLAAMEERRKEREQQKQAIQGALTKLDSQSANNSQHIVFNSESEEESEKEEEASTSNVQSDNMVTPAKSKLFDSSGEDSDDEEEKDDERFEIKTQYEGRSGAKLMQLQSRFGTDERFKMDARFLEDSSEDEEDEEPPQKLQADDDDDDDDGLSAEKKRNLDILQSVLKINVEPQPPGKKAKAKKFKDLNALQYDPTKEDHALFETKAEEEKKESKSEIKKKRLEAEKLPEVSKELFHEVTEDLKDVFSATKPQTMEVPETTWDQIEKPQKIETESSMADVDFSFQKKEESAGFTFSFFGTSAEESAPFDEPYKIETIKAAKVAWQENPRFQDSSSEGEEEEKDNSVTTSSHLEKSSSIRFFFFVKDDTRLKEGPKMFFRSSKSQQKAKEWDYMRDTIMEECKKRHKDAKRKLKSKR